MKRALYLLIASMSSLLYLAVGQFNHVVAKQMPHDLADMNHGSYSRSFQKCVTLCTSSFVYKQEDVQNSTLEKEDEDPVPPFYTVIQEHYANTAYVKLQKPISPDIPIKVPIHILYGVFRS